MAFLECELRKLTTNDGHDVYEMLQEFKGNENGFVNSFAGLSIEGFRQKLCDYDRMAKGIGLPEWAVPMTVYWLYVDDKPVGMGKLRHRLTEALLAEGGHIGYAINPRHRGKGYGNEILRLLLSEAAKLGIPRVLVTIHNGNIPSIKVALKNGGTIEKVSKERHYIWIGC